MRLWRSKWFNQLLTVPFFYRSLILWCQDHLLVASGKPSRERSCVSSWNTSSASSPFNTLQLRTAERLWVRNPPSVLRLKKHLLLFFQVGERIRVILDCDDNTLAFERNYEFLGVAFRGEFPSYLSQRTSCVSYTKLLGFWVEKPSNLY